MPTVSAQAASTPLERARGKPLDRIDRRIVAELQRDATLPLSALAGRVGLSQSPCWKRVQRLEETGVLTRRVALADPEKLGLGLTAFVSVVAPDHGAAWREAFVEVLDRLPEVVEVWRMAGEADYLLKVVTTDVAAFDALYRHLTETVALGAVTSRFAVERLAYTTALPLPPNPA